VAHELGASWLLNRDTEPFPSAFCDYASTVMPRSIREALAFGEYLFTSHGVYSAANDRLLSYFLTDTDVDGDDIGAEERKKYLEYFNEDLRLKRVQKAVGRDFLCLHGDTRAVTRDGVFRLRDLAGKTVDVLSEGGVYRPAAFKSFGRQELLEVEFSDGRKVLATPEHEWVAINCSNKKVRVPTTALVSGYRIERTVAPRPAQNDEFYEGVRHGFVFGDGSTYNGGKQAVANFYGVKDLGMLPYFEGYGSKPREYPKQKLFKVHGLPPRYKLLPSNDSSASYWYGFVCGFLAADGSVDTYGCAILTQKSRATLEAVAEQLPRIGMAAGPLRGHRDVRPNFVWPDGRAESRDCTMHYLTLLKRFVLPQDLLLPSHRAKFEKHHKPTKYGEYVGVKAVRPTGVVDEVFCCVEMATHTFVIDNGVLTGNCYGNTFNSLLVPFRRYFRCPRPRCGSEYPYRAMAEAPGHFGLRWEGCRLSATCPHCHYAGDWGKPVDRVDPDPKRIVVKRWDPKYVDIQYNDVSERRRIIWKVPPTTRLKIQAGYPHMIEDTPWEVIDCVRRGANFEFEPERVFHWFEEPLAGLDTQGWGLPRSLPNFRQAWYMAVLHRFNEAIAMDYVIPTRVVSPAPGRSQNPEAEDLLQTVALGDLQSRIESMFRANRRDPGRLNVSPIPLQYQLLGGEAKALAPSELLDQSIALLLNNIGYPVDFYKFSLQTQIAPVAARLLAAVWSCLVDGLNALTQWLADESARALSWERVTVRMKRTDVLDVLPDPTLAAQLAAQRLVSPSSALRQMGFEFKAEQRQILEDEKLVQELQAKLTEEMDQVATIEQLAPTPLQQMMAAAQQGAQAAPGAPAGAPAPGGAPAPAGAAGMAATGATANMPLMPNQSTTPQDVESRAQVQADQLMRMPESQRQSAMTKMKQTDPLVHSRVKVLVEQIHSDAALAGKAQVLAQNYGAV
jgi:hypothetical protein